MQMVKLWLNATFRYVTVWSLQHFVTVNFCEFSAMYFGVHIVINVYNLKFPLSSF